MFCVRYRGLHARTQEIPSAIPLLGCLANKPQIRSKTLFIVLAIKYSREMKIVNVLESIQISIPKALQFVSIGNVRIAPHFAGLSL